MMKETTANNNKKMTPNTNANKDDQKKNTDHTVFVRFVPPSAVLRRHHMEHYFSQIGPIKKASLIIPKSTAAGSSGSSTAKSSYGFIKYTCEADAKAAAQQLHKSTLKVVHDDNEANQNENEGTTSFQVMVELASNVEKQQKKNLSKDGAAAGKEGEKQGDHNKEMETKKKHNRIMIKNLSFYAKESHIRSELSKFGKLLEVHIPTVQGNQSRGFGFCTFDTQAQAQAAIDSSNKISIKNRKVELQWSVPKVQHQKQQEQADKIQRKQEYHEQVKEQLNHSDEKGTNHKNDEEDNDEDSSSSGDKDGDDDESDSGSSSSSDEEAESDSDSDEENKDSQENDKHHKKKDTAKKGGRDDTAIQEQRELFVRNLPFDATRHEIFEAFRTFGTVQAIYIVMNHETKLPRGTCFVTFSTQAGAARAMKQATINNNANSTASTLSSPLTSGIIMKNRPLLVDYAVDKETAATLKRDTSATTSAEKNHPGRDKRNIYLKGIGRVDNEEEWNSLLESDRNKRERAWSDKITKLKSPLFFINPNRLSIRNISKAVDDGALKKLLFDATQLGLKRQLVSMEDVIAHWRASGEFTAREILEKTKAFQNNNKNEEEPKVLSVDSLDEKNTKRTIPSVYLDRDFDAIAGTTASAAASSSGTHKKTVAPSRGFAFAEFTHHAHALACLRQLNNNPVYSEEYAAGGRAAAASLGAAKKRRHKKKKKRDKDDGEDDVVKIPRLIVEFTVENKAKARQQAEHRAQQQANRLKQKIETREKRELASGGDNKKEEGGEKSSKKRGRGAKQREKKRQRHLHGEDETDEADGATALEKAEAEKRKFRQSSTGETVVATDRVESEVPTLKAIKPPKRPKKREREDLEAEEKFSKLVDKYKAAFAGADAEGGNVTATVAKPGNKALESGKRWFE